MAKFVEFERGGRRLFINPELITGFSNAANNSKETVIYTGEKGNYFTVQHNIETVKERLESVGK